MSTDRLPNSHIFRRWANSQLWSNATTCIPALSNLSLGGTPEVTPISAILLYGTVALGVSFICSILEAVLLSTTRGHILALQSKMPTTAERWLTFKDDPERPLTAILTLNTIAHTVGALGVGSEVENAYPGEYALAIASTILTLLVLLLSEILPKTVGTLYWRRLTVSAGLILHWMTILLAPIVWPIEKTRGLLPSVKEEAMTRDEISVIADIAEETDVIDEREESVIQNLLMLKEMTVGAIMTPRTVMTYVESEETIGSVMERIPVMVHGRMPVFDEDAVVGMVLRSDILRNAAADNFDPSMTAIMRPISSVHSDGSIDAALRIMLENRVQILTVEEEFGTIIGLVTMEDVIETLLGVEIVDEADIEGIEEGAVREDMRELAMMRREEE
ncbi:MAG TPA: DUF21 domain-containing protein [Candidatus Thalassarchaeaceae archaeon]|nr:MAG TPA: DUF21 domain-containing protein [Candidatus Poseidoniales archaeon]HII90147.1 DUF21 domain-containing protein [Candidatus Thalassarchaeaceae archaeon]